MSFFSNFTKIFIRNLQNSVFLYKTHKFIFQILQKKKFQKLQNSRNLVHELIYKINLENVLN